MTNPADALGDKLDPAFAELREHLMRRIVLVVEGQVKKATRVRTGRLRQSIASRVERTGERGFVGTTVLYMLYQKNRPLTEGLAAAQSDIRRILAEEGGAFFKGIVSE